MPTHRLFRVMAGVCLAALMACGAELPRPSPDFTINFPNGKPVQISQYRGKVVALAFILTTCPHCQKTVGYLSALQNELGPRGLQVVASAIDEMAAMNLPDFISRFKPPFPVGLNSQNDVVPYLQHPVMLRLLMPQMVFIDRQGVIRAQYEGDDKFFETDQEKNLREQIETLLKESAPAAKKRAATKKAS